MKLLHSRFAQDQEFVERFRREASSAAGLQHPNVVGVYDRGEFDDTYYIAMEYCEGETLKQVITREAPLDPARAIAITKQILVAARFAHRRNVIHRDLKPHNVILDEEQNVKVTDFGIARAGASDITEVGAIMGTAQYLSPEQAQGRPVTEESDLYSIGVVLFELLTGRAPFEGDSPVAVALQHVNQPAPSPRELQPAVPPELEAVVLKALAKEPARALPQRGLVHQGARRRRGAPAAGAGRHREHGGLRARGRGAARAATAPPPLHRRRSRCRRTRGRRRAAAAGDRRAAASGRRGRNPWVVAGILAAVAAIAIGAVLLLGSGEQVVVPPVVGQTLEQAGSGSTPPAWASR